MAEGKKKRTEENGRERKRAEEKGRSWSVYMYMTVSEM
jgi:hypothetical protein